MASVYCSIVQQTKNGIEFYIKHFPEVAGRPYADARWVSLEASGLACSLRWHLKKVTSRGRDAPGELHLCPSSSASAMLSSTLMHAPGTGCTHGLPAAPRQERPEVVLAPLLQDCLAKSRSLLKCCSRSLCGTCLRPAHSTCPVLPAGPQHMSRRLWWHVPARHACKCTSAHTESCCPLRMQNCWVLAHGKHRQKGPAD